MKKTLSMILALVMVLALCACGNQAEAPAPTQPSAEPTTETPTETNTPATFELTGPVTLIVPYATGGSTDAIGRIVAQYLGEVVGQQINVVNKEGASGTVGSTELAQSKADGYTIGYVSNSDLYVADYRGIFAVDSLNYLAQINSVPFGLYAAPNSPWNTLEELIEDIKGGNTDISCAESGVAQLITIAQLCEAAGIDMIKTVNFSSGGESQTALLGNHVDLASLGPNYRTNVEAGGGKLLCIYGTSKLAQYPDAPYALDYGYEIPAIVGTNQCIALPQGCSDEVVEFWSNAIQEMIANPEFQETMATGGYNLVNITGDELANSIQNSVTEVAAIMKELGLE